MEMNLDFKVKEKPKLLLHICCGPDATAVYERLDSDYEVYGFFHNPNIHPENEYVRRKNAAERVSREMENPLLIPHYNPDIWLDEVKGLEKEPEKGKRCFICFQQNLRATAQRARSLGFQFFTTTLTISPHKNSEQILTLGKSIAQEFGLKFLAQDFKKQDGFKRSLKISLDMNLYRQNYCGCRFSNP